MNDDTDDTGKVNILPLLLMAVLAWLVFGQDGGCTLPSVGGGATEFIVLHEATKDDEAFAKIAQTLQDQESTVGKAIIDAGWKCLVLDDDAKDKDDQPSPLLKSLGVHGSIVDAHRELVSFNPPAKLVKRETLPADATAEAVMEMIRARGKRK